MYLGKRHENVILSVAKDPVPSYLRTTRKGVSLITVLLFMLVATIAATATYKWITSEGRSSGSRMLEREAYQSSLAGIESAISWMTYHANDVGALIRQYKTSGNKAVSLDDQLVELVRPGQNFHVWLTGVSTEGSPYKLKIVSEGVARNGAASHSEVAILNVDGLYRVKRPTTKSTINFDKAFFGGTSGLRNSPIVESAIINGNYSGNVPKITKHLIVTGKATLEGATDIAGADMYIKGDISIQGVSKFGAAGNVAYIGGSVTDCAGQKFTAGGDLLVEGNFGAKCGVDVAGNFTIGGILYRTNDNGDFKVGKNLVFKKDATLNYGGDKSYTVGVGENTYLSNITGKDGSGNRVINLGKKIYLYSSFPSTIMACQNACNKGTGSDWQGFNCYNRCPDDQRTNYCEGFFEASKCFIGSYGANVGKASDRYFSFYSYEETGRVQSKQPVAWKDDDAVLKDVSNNYWNNIRNMNALGNLIDKTTNKVPQPILLKNKEAWIGQLKNGYCGLNEDGKFKMSNDVVTTLNTCYQTASGAGQLYNGFLPIIWNPTEKGDVTSALEHKFILYVPTKLNQTEIPPTTENGVVFLYLKNGATDLQGHSTCLKSEDANHPCAKNDDNSCKTHGPTDNKCILSPSGNRYFTYTYNYLIYSEGENNGSQGSENVYMQHIPISGAVIMGKTSSGADSKLLTGDVMVDLQYNATVMKAVADADLIYENPDYTTLATGKAAGGGGAAIAGAGAPDDYYIAVAPQLSITIESQYANKESIDNIVQNGQDATGSFIVLPRIIYLSRTPNGTLDQYYNVISLNSRVPAQNKSISPVTNQSVSCDGIPANGPLVPSPNHKLTPGNYTCNVTGTVAGTESTVPFYVVVPDDGAGSTDVAFVEASKELKTSDGEYEVQLRVPVSSSPTKYYVTVSYPDFSDEEWNVQKVGGSGDNCQPGGECVFEINPSTAIHTIFKVRNKAATSGQKDFQIIDANGCGVGTPYTASIIASTKIEVERKSLKDWCSITENSGDALCASKDAPPCPDIRGEWITASGCSYISPNERWSCRNSGTISLEPVYSGIPDGCEVIIPGANEKSAPFKELETLYASAFAKPFTFTAGFSAKTGDGATVSDGQKIHIAVYRKSDGVYGSNPILTSDCSYEDFKDSEKNAEKCQVAVYYGDQVTLTLNPENPATFNYWMCESGTDCPSPKAPDPSYSHTLVVTGADRVFAHFDEKDKHCFFDEFKNGSYTNRAQIMCGSGNSETEYCIGTDGTSKWKLQSGNAGDIEFAGDGRISLKSNATRGQKQDSKGSATIMSTVKAGVYGTLKAQFQVPREEISSGDISKSTVKQSGFILRSNTNVSSYLMLNVFSDKNNYLKARVCLNGESPCMESRIGNATASQGDVILVAATLKKNQTSENDELEIRAYTGIYNSSNQAHTFELTQANLNGVQNLTGQGNESVGFRLSDQNFKIYGIGWLSEDYRSECWDSFPIITCSFKAAYPGGIVPRSDLPKTGYRKPWVGFSKWFDDNGANCTPTYYYNGSDAGCSYGAMGSSYQTCAADGYYFSGNESEGVHGVGDVKVARAGASGTNCNISGEAAPWADSDPPEIAAHCGAFWVGTQTNCKKHAKFEQTVTSGAEGTYFGIKPPEGSNAVVTANLRKSELIVEMENSSGSEVEIYLFSNNADLGGAYGYGTDYVYSLPYTTKASNVTIDVDAISNAEGFDPERVVGVYVKGESVNVTSVRSNCPYALGLAGCEASYNPTNDKWTITATVNGIEDAGTLNIPSVKIGGGTTKTVSGASKVCYKSPSDCVSGNTQTWETVWGSDKGDGLPYISDTHTPYYYLGSNNSVNYVFTVTLTDSEGNAAEGSPCTKATDGVSKITATCSINKPSVNQGQGIPQLTYSISGCPATDEQNPKCGYAVKLYNGSTYIKDIATSNKVSGALGPVQSGHETETNYGNSTSDYLPTGTDYKLVLESTNSEYPFASCERSFEVKDVNAATGDLDCDFPANVVKGTSQKFTVDNKIERQNFNIYFDNTKLTGGNNGEYWIESGNNQEVWVSVPNDEGLHTYKITKKDDTEALCTGTFNTANALTCKIKNPVKINEENTFELTAMSGISLSNCNYTNVNCGYNCQGQPLADQKFTVTGTSPVTLKARCQISNTNINVECSAVAEAEVIAPTLTCPDPDETTINAEPGANVTITPISVGNCAGGCTYWVNNKVTGDKVTPETNGSITTQTSVTFPGESKSGENTYTLSVNNAKGTATCDVLVDYKKPSYSCPGAITAEPGTQVTVTPVLGSPSYCSGGCDYKITGTGIDDIEGENFSSGPLADKIVDTNNPITGTAVTGGVAKKYSLTLSNAAGSGTACDVTVNYMKPTFTCPDNKEAFVDDEVEIDLGTPGYCANGCSYRIIGGTFVDNSTSGSSFTSGKIKKIKGESTASSDAGTDYTLKLHNAAGDDIENCTFKVKYKEKPVEVCECSKYCDDCSTITTGSGTYNDGSYRCVFFTSASELNLSGSNTKINGTKLDANPQCYSTSACNSHLSGLNIEKANGGYFMNLPGWNYAAVKLSGSVPEACSGGGGGGGGGEFTCTAGNSTSISSSPFNISASTCYKYYSGGSNWQVGNYSGSTVSVTYKKCDGTVSTVSAPTQNWTAVDVGGQCDVLATFGSTTSLQFGSW